MKIVVIGGTGLIGSKTVAILRHGGHEVVAASPRSGVNTITGEGLKEAVAGTQVVIDLANSPSFEDKAVLEFFETSGRNLLAAEAAADVRHHVALSIVAIDRTDNGYFRAKVAQEKLITSCGSGGQGHATHVKGSSGESRQGRSDDHSRESARRVERQPPTQCACVCLRAGGLRRDAAEGRTRGDTDTRRELL